MSDVFQKLVFEQGGERRRTFRILLRQGFGGQVT
jgi:hypothetical protein